MRSEVAVTIPATVTAIVAAIALILAVISLEEDVRWQLHLEDNKYFQPYLTLLEEGEALREPLLLKRDFFDQTVVIVFILPTVIHLFTNFILTMKHKTEYDESDDEDLETPEEDPDYLFLGSPEDIQSPLPPTTAKPSRSHWDLLTGPKISVPSLQNRLTPLKKTSNTTKLPSEDAKSIAQVLSKMRQGVSGTKSWTLVSPKESVDPRARKVSSDYNSGGTIPGSLRIEKPTPSKSSPRRPGGGKTVAFKTTVSSRAKSRWKATRPKIKNLKRPPATATTVPKNSLASPLAALSKLSAVNKAVNTDKISVPETIRTLLGSPPPPPQADQMAQVTTTPKKHSKDGLIDPRELRFLNPRMLKLMLFAAVLFECLLALTACYYQSASARRFQDYYTSRNVTEKIASTNKFLRSAALMLASCGSPKYHNDLRRFQADLVVERDRIFVCQDYKRKIITVILCVIYAILGTITILVIYWQYRDSLSFFNADQYMVNHLYMEMERRRKRQKDSLKRKSTHSNAQGMEEEEESVMFETARAMQSRLRRESFSEDEKMFSPFSMSQFQNLERITDYNSPAQARRASIS